MTIVLPGHKHLPSIRQMQGNVVKYAQYLVRLKVRNQRVSILSTGQQHIEHVARWITLWWNHRQSCIVALRPVVKLRVVIIPYPSALGLNLFSSLQLSAKKGCQEIRKEIARSQIHLRILIDLPTIEPAAIGTFVTND